MRRKSARSLTKRQLGVHYVEHQSATWLCLNHTQISSKYPTNFLNTPGLFVTLRNVYILGPDVNSTTSSLAEAFKIENLSKDVSEKRSTTCRPLQAILVRYELKQIACFSILNQTMQERREASAKETNTKLPAAVSVSKLSVLKLACKKNTYQLINPNKYSLFSAWV